MNVNEAAARLSATLANVAPDAPLAESSSRASTPDVPGELSGSNPPDESNESDESHEHSEAGETDGLSDSDEHAEPRESDELDAPTEPDSESGESTESEILNERKKLAREKEVFEKERETLATQQTTFKKNQEEFFGLWAKARDDFQVRANALQAFFSDELADIQRQAQEAESLRISSPTEWQSITESLNRQWQNVQGRYQEAQKVYEQQRQAHQAQAHDIMQKVVLQAIPNYSQTDNEYMGEALTNFGLGEQMQHITDPRILLMAHDYTRLKRELTRLQEESTNKKKAAADSLVKARSAKKTGAQSSKKASSQRRPSSKEQARGELRKRFNKSQSVKDAAALLKDLF